MIWADEIALVLERAGRAHRNDPVECFVKRNHADHVDGAQRADAGARRVAGHFNFRAAHASGFVEHQHDGRGLFRRRLGAHRQHFLERRLGFLGKLGVAVARDKNQSAARVDVSLERQVLVRGKFVIGIIVEQDRVPIPRRPIHRESRDCFHVDVGLFQGVEQRRGSFVAARDVQHVRPAHRNRARHEDLLGAGAGNVHFQKVDAAARDPRFQIDHVAARRQIRRRRGDFLALGRHPDARLHRAAAVETKRHRETFS